MNYLQHTRSVANLPAPLSTRLRTAREQLSAMFMAGELDALPDDTRHVMRGLELALLEFQVDAWELECAARRVELGR